MKNKKKFSQKAGILILGALTGFLLMQEYHCLTDEIAMREQSTSIADTTVPAAISEVSVMPEKVPAQEIREEKSLYRGTTARTTATGEEPLIRVLLMTSDYESYFHPSVTVVSDGEEITYTPESVAGAIIRITPQNGLITVKSIRRSLGVPAYGGTLEIRTGSQGLLVINELPMEEYLCQVVPSEMPVSYAKEALKAQAVCARTYAWRQYRDEKLKDYFAHVDDSVAFQVYGNVQGDDHTRRAVEETRGQIITQDGEPIQAYYFSTSAGNTSTDEVWEPEEEANYLKSVVCSYDAAEPWSQWEVFFPTTVLNQRIYGRYGTIGELFSLEVMERSTGGAVKALRILTDKESRIVRNEYDIRALFSPEGLPITRKDESVTEGGKLLPSAYFHMNTVQGENGMEGYTFIGGGYGHGVGMSQNGANHMAMEGKTFEEIIHYFFREVEISRLSSDKAETCQNR